MSSRRNFIRTVLLSTGAVFVSWKDLRGLTQSPHIRASLLHGKRVGDFLRNSPSFSQPPRTTDVVIVGGGPAGLATAWGLRKQGREVIVLENEPNVGGTLREPFSWNGIPYPLGSTYFYRYNGQYRDFYNDIGAVPIQTGEDALVVEGGAVIPDWWNTRNLNSLPFSTADREAFQKFRGMLLAMAVPSYPLATAPASTIAEYDSISGLAFMRRFGSERLTSLVDLFSRSVLGAPLDVVNAYSLINFYALEFGEAFQIPCYTFPGGLGEIATKARSHLGENRIVTNSAVVRVENHAQGVTVHYVNCETGEGQSIRAAKAIVAMSKRIARRIVADLPIAQRSAMARIRYAPYITVALCCNAPLFSVRAFDFWITDKRRRFTDVIDVTSAQDAQDVRTSRTKYVYMLSSPRPEGDRTLVEDEVWLVRTAQGLADALNEHIPGCTQRIEEMHVMGWGRSMVIPAVGSYRSLAPVIARRHGNIHFVHSDNDLAPSVENALGVAFEIGNRL